MRIKLFAFAALTLFLVFSPSSADAFGWCEDKTCCHERAACCRDQGNMIAARVLIPPLDPIEPVTVVARQVAVVLFMKPVKVGDSILLGKYIIEHDNDRMARGLPCTHIYAAGKPQVPVVKFHCTHLERGQAERNTVVLNSTGDVSVPSAMVAFQFAGETAAHGVPTGR
jgi:hypothetical protein